MKINNLGLKLRKHPLLVCFLVFVIIVIIYLFYPPILDIFFKSPHIVDFNLKYPHFVDWVLAFGTILLALVALYKEGILNRLKPPEFKIIIPKTITEKDEAKLTYRNGYNRIKSGTGAFILIDIKNIGFGVAKNVKVYLSGEKTNSIINFHRYKSLPLFESWTANDTISSLYPGQRRCFTLGNVFKELSDKITIGSNEIGPNTLKLIKCTSPTWFEFYIEVFADNAESKRIKVRIDFDCNYCNMLNITKL